MRRGFQSIPSPNQEPESVTVFRILELGTSYHKPRHLSCWSVMKAKRSKAHKKTPVRKKSKSKTPKKARPIQRRPRPPQGPTTTTVTTTTLSIPGFETCEEPEVGDIGGFGDVDAFESHEKLCGEKATEFCGTCAKNLCTSHYELLHRDHDAGGHHLTERSMTQ